MAVLQGRQLDSTQGGITDPLLAIDLYRRSYTGSIGAANTLRRPGGAKLQTHWPVETNSRALQVTRGRAHIDDFYYRIHIHPKRLDLGNVVSTQSSPVTVWNAHLEPRTLTAINGLDDGIEVSGQPEPPLLFMPLQERVWQLSVTPDGQPVLDTLIEWQFDDEAPGIQVTANRIIPWSFVPNWAEGVLERLTAATDILQSESAVSQRRALRIGPRREFEAPIYIEGRERQLLDLALFGWGARIWALPLWADIQRLDEAVAAESFFIPCATENLDFRIGGMAMLRGEDAFSYEVVEIAAITADGLQLKRATQQSWQPGTRLYPARSAQLQEQPSLSKLTDALYQTRVRFLITETSDWPEVLPAVSYRDYPVWDRRPDDSENLTHGFERLLSSLDSGTALPLLSDTAGRGLTLLGQRQLFEGRTERAALRSLIYALHGRQKAVWVPTHMDDLTLAATVSAEATTLDVANIGYARFSNGKPGRRDIRIELHDGRVFMRRIIGAIELDGQTERLGLDTVLGVQIQPHQVARVSWLVLCRLNSDAQEIEHLTDSEGIAVWSPVFREERDDEL